MASEPRPTVVVDGKALANQIRSELAREVATLVEAGRRPPQLAVVLVGDDPASASYIKGKRRACARVGFESTERDLPASASEADVLDAVAQLNADPDVDGILVQLPLPPAVRASAVAEAIDPAKDVDGLHPHNLGLLVLNRTGPRPCTPSGVMRLLDHYGIPTSGKRAVVVGRSFLVGRPLALMLSAKGADATVALAHSRTEDLAVVTREADILVAAVGVASLIGARHVKPGAVVIDVGINRSDEGLVGDVDFDAVSEVASAVTPVPGGVGPMTRAMLMANTVWAAERRAGLRAS